MVLRLAITAGDRSLSPFRYDSVAELGHFSDFAGEAPAGSAAARLAQADTSAHFSAFARQQEVILTTSPKPVIGQSEHGRVDAICSRAKNRPDQPAEAYARLGMAG